ncbi:lysylphosphatidylglycerol synthase transmembrane domain-containing protein [Methanobacterium alcaliphilum]|uniref:lysylphosphatidylglycerol synthase transmembrane domain-containing protein n=1 Tax=Methanobacterium alcaliphilum TaxID=392018 RepID=UPI00200B91E0|nr:lysylphosphatidylglycerol synthase transmembrane domain-containing protein [Methanobacterium alcaliphilum]MCK9151776.1 flippase-like domain-containing protein [Methanobacterium alcaliphilum]
MSNYNIKTKNNIIKIVISLILLLFLFKTVNFNLFIESILEINAIFILALIILPFSIFLRAWRWKILINKDKAHVSYKEAYDLTLVGVALNIFLPASMGDVAKSYYGYKWHGLKEEMLSSSILDKFLALLSIFIIGFFSSLWMGFYIYAIISLVLCILIGTLIFIPKIIPWSFISKIFKIFTKINLDHQKMNSFFLVSLNLKTKAVLISFLGWILSYIQFYLVCLSFNVDVNFLYVLSIAPIINLALIFPLTLNGLGSGDVVVVYLLGLAGISGGTALAISLFYSQFLTTLIPGFFGFIKIIRK